MAYIDSMVWYVVFFVRDCSFGQAGFYTYISIYIWTFGFSVGGLTHFHSEFIAAFLVIFQLFDKSICTSRCLIWFFHVVNENWIFYIDDIYGINSYVCLRILCINIMRILEVDLHKVFLEKMENVQMTSILYIISFWVFQYLRFWIEWTVS